MIDFNRFIRGLTITNGQIQLYNHAGLQHCSVREHLKYAKINLSILEKLAKKEAENAGESYYE